MRIIAIDGGTTSTKAWMVEDGAVTAHSRSVGGARDLAAGKDRDWLARLVTAVAQSALVQSGGSWDEVAAVVAFGMITSEHGLREVPHLPAPVGVERLAEGLQQCSEALSIPVPLYLVPGVIRDVGGLSEADFMRGEETQVMGLLASGITDPPLLYVSAGSHAKFVYVGAEGLIHWSFTTLSGEMLWALSQETVLSDVLDPSLPMVDGSAVDRGTSLEKQAGLGRALFAGRLLNRIEDGSTQTCTDFIRGAIASADMRGVRCMEGLPPKVVLGDASGLAPVYARLLEREPWVGSVVQTELPLGALGAWEIWKNSPSRRLEQS